MQLGTIYTLGSIYTYYNTVGTISKDILQKTLNGYTQFPVCCCLRANQAVLWWSQPVFCLWVRWWCSWQRAGGGYPGGSPLVPPPERWSRPDADAAQCSEMLECTFERMSPNNPRHWVHSHTNAGRKLASATFFRSSPLRWERKPPLI